MSLEVIQRIYIKLPLSSSISLYKVVVRQTSSSLKRVNNFFFIQFNLILYFFYFLVLYLNISIHITGELSERSG